MTILERARQETALRRNQMDPSRRPAFHLSAPVGWINDPNGFGWFQNKAHLFYQFHPYDSVWGPMHWGHWISEDLVHWQEAPVAIAPDQPYDCDGCFSGTSVEKDGRLMLMYTGVQPAEASKKSYQHQCIAESEDGVQFVKWAQNPVLGREMLPPDASPYDFRDPKVEKTADGFRAIVASEGPEGGQLLAYTSADLRRWQYAGVYVDHLARMSECPDVFELNGKTVLVVCEVGADAARFGASQVSLYAAGHEENGRFCAEHPLRTVDQGLDFYAPQTMQTPDGRRILIGWAQSWSHVTPSHTLGHGWAGLMTLPRECTLDEDGVLCQKPVEELKALRRSEVRLENLAVDGRTDLAQLAGRQREWEMEIDMQEAQSVTLNLMQTGEERFTASYDRSSGTLRLDRSRCGYPFTADLSPEKKPWCEAKVPLRNGKLQWHVFVDACVIEIYADGGRTVMSSLAFPQNDEYGVSIESDGPVKVSFTGWTLENA